MTTPKLGMPELSVSQASKEITHNQALAILDQTSQLTVISRASTPPGSPANGAAYIVTATAAGYWAGKEGHIAYWLNSVAAWQFIATANGWLAWSDADAKTYRKESGSWVELATGGGGASNATQAVAVSAGSLNLSATTAEIIVVDLNQNITSITLPSGVSGQAVNRRIVFTQSGSANYSVSGWSGVTIEGGTAPAASTGTGSVTEYMLSNTDNGGWRMYVDQLNGLISSDTGSIGFKSGAGGDVTQATSKTTSVTINKPCGQITMNGAALAANSSASFTVNNTAVSANDLPKVVIKSGATAGAYLATVDAVSSGSFRISIRNLTAGSLSEAVVLQFSVEKGAIA